MSLYAETNPNDEELGARVTPVYHAKDTNVGDCIPGYQYGPAKESYPWTWMEISTNFVYTFAKVHIGSIRFNGEPEITDLDINDDFFTYMGYLSSSYVSEPFIKNKALVISNRNIDRFKRSTVKETDHAG